MASSNDEFLKATEKIQSMYHRGRSDSISSEKTVHPNQVMLDQAILTKDDILLTDEQVVASLKLAINLQAKKNKGTTISGLLEQAKELKIDPEFIALAVNEVLYPTPAPPHPAKVWLKKYWHFGFLSGGFLPALHLWSQGATEDVLVPITFLFVIAFGIVTFAVHKYRE